MASKYQIDTEVIHAGQAPDPITGAVMTPIYTASTYVQPEPGEPIDGYDYSRAKNPTRLAYEQCVAALECGEQGFAFASGCAAIAAILDLLQPGDHVIASDDLYGGTFRLFDQIRARSAGLQFSFIDFNDKEALNTAIRENTKMIWLESPSNPLLKLIDLKRVAEFAQEHKLLSVVDNTFATPISQQPLTLGFDLVVHSATKYLGGHSDVISGVVVVGDHADIAERLSLIHYGVGAIAGPFDSYLVLRGIKTLAIRMQRHNENAIKIAQYLQAHSKVKKVIYPGLPSHPQHTLATQQMKLYGGIVSVHLNCDLAETLAILKRCRFFQLAESLGGVESLIEHPALMTHASIPAKKRTELGIDDSLIRLSVGIEGCDDLIEDLERALG